MKVLVLTLIFSLFIPLLCYCEISSPKGIAAWFKNEFTYELTFPDKPKDLDEFIKTKRGDCEEFARLAQRSLVNLGYNAQAIVVEFTNLRARHAICVWMDKNGSYSFISNQEIYHTNKKSIKGLLAYYYSDYERWFSYEQAIRYLNFNPAISLR